MALLWMVFITFSLGLVELQAQQAVPIREAEEWILTRASSKITWKKLLSGYREFELIETFGPKEKYSLVRARAKLTRKLPSDIIGIQRNYSYRTLELNDPDFVKSWALSNSGQTIPEFGTGEAGVDIGAKNSWGIEAGNRKIVIALLDTGIDLAHEDLKNNLWMNFLEIDRNSLDDDNNGFINDMHGWNFTAENSNIQDDNNHGSAVAGVVAADANNGRGSRGFLEVASLMIVKILDSNGSGTTERAVRGIEYAVKNGASVINASWGGGHYDQVLFDTIKWANQKGVLIVCAAGNDAKDNDTDANPTFPASFKIPNIISVAAHDPRGELASFSNYGKETVHISAPGVGIYSTIGGGYQWMNGTSFATPFVSAIAGLLKWREPNLTPDKVRDRLVSTAIPMHYYLQNKLASGGRAHGFNTLKNIHSEKPQPPKIWKRLVKNIESDHPYLNSSHSVFEIKQPGATHIRVHFTKIDLENQYDFLLLRDREGRVAMSYSGKQDSFWSAEVLGEVLKIELVSDFSNAQWGFAIDAIEVAE